MRNKLYLAIIFFAFAFSAHATMLLIPMDSTQSNHLKAYGVTYRILNRGGTADLLLNYRGGSFAIAQSLENETECTEAGVSYQQLSNENYAAILAEIAEPASNMDVIKLDKCPKIAVYTPKTAMPWDDAVTLALTYAGIPYDKIYDDEVLDGKLAQYDWLHLHHEDFTGQYGKFYSSYGNAEWYKAQVAGQEALAARRGFTKVSKMKLEVCHLIRDFVAAGGYMFAMCSAPESFDMALAAENTDICDALFDHDPQDPNAQAKLDYSQCFAFENWHLCTKPMEYKKSDIDVTYSRRVEKKADYFTLANYDAKLNPAEAMLCQNHQKAIHGFVGQTTAFNKGFIKKGVSIMAEDIKGTEARYIHGQYGKGMWTWYGGHDPEDYCHFVGNPPTDLSKYPNSPGYRLILNNIFLPSANLPETENTVSSIKIYPNPSGSLVNVSGQTGGSQYLLFTESGKLMQSGIFDSETAQLDISQFPNGIYLLQVAGKSFKVVKMK